MKFAKLNLSILAVAFSIVGVSQAYANDELNSEINDLQVQIIHKGDRPAPAPAPRRVVRYSRPRTQIKPMPRPVVVASNTMATPQGTTSFYDHSPRYAYSAPYQAPVNTYSAEDPALAPRNPFRRLELVPAVAISSFDGSDAGQLQPSGLSNTSNTSFAGSLLTDISFGSEYFVGETGISAMQLGGTVGYAAGNGVFNSTAYSEKVGLTYVGVPLDVKWLVSGEGNSSVYVKAGATPSYLAQHSYSSSTNINNEYRFGGYHLFDVLMSAGVGYDLKVYKDIHVVIDLSVFQGMIPVLDNYNVYNYGAIGGSASPTSSKPHSFGAAYAMSSEVDHFRLKGGHCAPRKQEKIHGKAKTTSARYRKERTQAWWFGKNSGTHWLGYG